MKVEKRSNPIFSIIIPTYNRAAMLERSIESVLNQSFENWELIIVDDGSTDHTAALISKYRDPRLHYFYKDNEERSVARNYGVDKGKGQYYCFLDSDDLYLPRHLEKHYEQITNNSNQIAAYCSGLFIEQDGERKAYPHILNNKRPIENIWKYGYNLLPFCWPKEIVKALPFDPEMIYMEDLNFILSALNKNPLVAMKEATCVVLQHKERSIETRFKQKLLEEGRKNIYSINKIMKEHQGFLLDHISVKELGRKKKVLLRAFIKASIKKVNVKALYFFISNYFKASA